MLPELMTPTEPEADGDAFLTAPLGWWMPKTASPPAGMVLRTGTAGRGGEPRSCTMA
jgi:hypothetical protein